MTTITQITCTIMEAADDEGNATINKRFKESYSERLLRSSIVTAIALTDIN